MTFVATKLKTINLSKHPPEKWKDMAVPKIKLNHHDVPYRVVLEDWDIGRLFERLIDRKFQFDYLDLSDDPPYDHVLLRIKRAKNVWVIATDTASGKYWLHCMMPAGHGFILAI